MPNMNRTLEEFLDDATLLLHAPEFLDYEESDLEQDLRHEIVLCESAAAIMARVRLASLLDARPGHAGLHLPMPTRDDHQPSATPHNRMR